MRRLVCRRLFVQRFIAGLLAFLFLGMSVAAPVTKAQSSDPTPMTNDQLRGVSEFPNWVASQCSTSSSGSAAGSSISGDLQALAKQITDNKNITYDGGPNGPTGTQFKHISEGQKAQTDNGREVDVQPIVLVTVLHLAQGHKVNISALTDGSSHTAPTNPHGSGRAIDVNIFDGQHNNGSDSVAQSIINTAAEVLPEGARFGMGNSPFGTKQINGKTFSSFSDFPTHVHIDVQGVSQAADDAAVAAASGSSGSSGAVSGGVYVLGDSITARSQTQYQDVFQKKALPITIDASSSRSITGSGIDGNKLSGLDAIDQDKSQIEKAATVVVALGTNGTTKSKNVDDVIDAIQKINASAKIYWVDTISSGRSDNYNESVLGPANRAIYGEATQKNYQVISWFKAVNSDGDPQHPKQDEADPNGYIDGTDGLGVHPSATGSTALANLVADAISNKAPSTPSCCPAGTGGGDSTDSITTNLTGNTIGEKVFNYFRINKNLSSDSAAAIAGNLEIESAHWTVVDGWGGGGGNYYGIAQWDRSNRYAGLVRFAGSTQNAAKLNFQLDYIWHELHNGYESTLQNIQGSSSLEDKTIFWVRHYEGAVNGDGSLQMPNERVAAAQQWAKNKGDGGPSGSNDSGGSTCAGTSNSGSGGYKNPFHDMKNLQPSRIDEGVDFWSNDGTTVPVYALGNAEVTKVADGNSTFYPPLPNWITYKLTDGPAQGKYVYVSEACKPLVHEGQKITSDTKLCEAEHRSIEMGWALDATSQAAAAYSVYGGHDGYETAYGVNFNKLLVKLGAPTGTLDTNSDPSGEVRGQLPPDWPKW
jgi:lysophospholipase L1-like esterase